MNVDYNRVFSEAFLCAHWVPSVVEPAHEGLLCVLPFGREACLQPMPGHVQEWLMANPFNKST
jgi:hypothetical protein